MGMAVLEIQLSKQMIDWIASSNGISKEDLAEQVMPKKTDKFLSGLVSKGVAEKLAKIGGIPFGYLFLENPPHAPKPKIPDLRQSVEAVTLGKDFFDVYHDIEYKMEWYKDFLKEIGSYDKKNFIGKFKFTEKLNHQKVADDIVNTIDFDQAKEARSTTIDGYFSKAAKLIENVGILVFKNGVVGNNNNRRLNTNEFRGFCIADEVTPIIFVNGSDALSAQVFTLFHEIAHLWLGVDGVSGWDTEKKVEAFCNRVSAEILMPYKSFFTAWEESLSDSIYYKVKEVSRLFKVSDFACAIRANQLGFIDGHIIETLKQEALKKIKKDTSGGSFFNTLPVRNSQKLTNIIVSRAMSQQLPLREAGALLNVKADTIVEFYKKRAS